jgi:hypothetical protein
MELVEALKLLGACVVGGLSKHYATHLVAAGPGGSKVMKAREWQREWRVREGGCVVGEKASIHIVSHRWVMDCLRYWQHLPEDAYSDLSEPDSSEQDAAETRLGTSSSSSSSSSFSASVSSTPVSGGGEGGGMQSSGWLSARWDQVVGHEGQEDVGPGGSTFEDGGEGTESGTRDGGRDGRHVEGDGKESVAEAEGTPGVAMVGVAGEGTMDSNDATGGGGSRGGFQGGFRGFDLGDALAVTATPRGTRAEGTRSKMETDPDAVQEGERAGERDGE